MDWTQDIATQIFTRDSMPPGICGLTCDQVHDQVLKPTLTLRSFNSAESVLLRKNGTKQIKSKLRIYNVFFLKKIKKNSLSLRLSDFSHLVSEGFCLTRNFLFGIPISAALTQCKNKGTQTMNSERGKRHVYKCDTWWQKQIILKECTMKDLY